MADQGEGELRPQRSSGYGVTGATVACKLQASVGEEMQPAQKPGCGHFLSYRDPGVSPGVPAVHLYILSSVRDREVLTATLAWLFTGVSRMKSQVVLEGRGDVTGASSGGGTVTGLAGHIESQLSAGQQGFVDCFSSACCPTIL